MIALIAAKNKKNVIGNNNQIPWKIKGEQKHFKELTTGNIVIMGRNTYESIGKPLPNRTNFIVSTSGFIGDADASFKSLSDAIDGAKNTIAKENLFSTKNIFIIGGEMLYKAAMPIVNTMFITEINNYADGDRFFPEFNESQFLHWQETEILDGIECIFHRYERKLK